MIILETDKIYKVQSISVDTLNVNIDESGLHVESGNFLVALYKGAAIKFQPTPTKVIY